MVLSNKTLVVILLLTMVVTIFGSLITLNRIEGVSEFKTFTGAWAGPAVNSTYGAINLTITSQLIINFTMDNVSFGSGYVKSGASACVLSTGETAEDTAGCASFNTPGIVHGLLLENIGNEYAEVNLSNRNWSSSMIGGTEPGYAWKWSNVSNDVNVTCEDYNFTGADIIYNTFVNLTSSNYLGENGNNIGKVLCKKLNYTDGSNDINITFKLHIPQNAPARTLDDIWFAFATLAS